MFSLTSAKAIYGALFFTTTLSLGGVLANRSFLTATGLVGSYGTAMVLLKKDKELLGSVSIEDGKHSQLEDDLSQLQEAFKTLQLSTQESDRQLKQELDLLQQTVTVEFDRLDVEHRSQGHSEPEYSRLRLDVGERLNQLEEVFKALQHSTQESDRQLRQELNLLQQTVTVQDNVDSVSLNSQEYFEQQYSELELHLNQLQEVVQSLQLSTQKDDRHLEHDLKLLLTRVNAQHAKTQRCVQSNRDQLKHRVTKLENILSQNTATLAKLSKGKKVEPLLINPPTKQQSTSETTPKISPRSPKTIVFIDQSNFYHACEKMGIEPDYGSLMCMLTPEIGQCEIRIYLGVYNPPSQRQVKLNQELQGLGYQVIEHPIATYADGNKKVVGDDHQLTCDLLTMVLNGEISDLDQVVLMSDDGDFKPLLQQIKQQGITVELIAYKPSAYLIPLVNRVTHLNKIKYDICQYQRFETA